MYNYLQLYSHALFAGLSICGSDCLLSAEWKSPNKIIARTGPAKGKGDICVTTLHGGVGTSTVQFRAYHESIGPMKESAVWIEESPMQSLAWGRRSLAPAGYSQEDPLGLSIEGNEKKITEDLRDLFPDSCGDLSQENFSPGWFLLEHHNATSFEDLKAGLSYLRRKVHSQRDGQLSFLKANTGSVIDQLDTLMMLREKFDDDVKEFGLKPVEKLELTIQMSITESNSLFTDVLSRREKADSTRAALLALSRHRFLFCLPNSVVRSAKKEDYDIVVNDYARCKNLFGKTEVPIFKKVLEEVDQRILEIRKELHTKVRHMPQSVDRQKKFVKALVCLEVQQSSSTVANQLSIVDPAWDAIESRAKYLEETFRQTYDQYTAKDVSASSTPIGSNSSATKPRDPNAQPNRVQFCEEITEIAAGQLPDLWRLGQAYFTGELRGVTEPKPDNFKRIILTSIEQFCSYLRAAILSASGQKTSFTGGASSNPLTWPNNSTSAIGHFLPWLPQCLRFVRTSYATLIRLDLPSEVLDIVQKLIDQIRLYCLTTIFKKALIRVKSLHDKEMWLMNVPEFPGATSLPSYLEALLSETLDEGQATCLTPEIREQSILEPQSDGQREVSERLQDILIEFCRVINALALERCDDEQQPVGISQLIGFPNSSSSGGGGGGQSNGLADCDKVWVGTMTWEQRLLCCLANCSYCNKVFLPNLGGLFTKFGYPVPKLAIETGRASINDLFCSLLDTYVEHKSDPLVGTIEPSMYIGRFQWDLMRETGKLQPYAHECCDNLVAVYSEIYTIAPMLLRPVLEQIIQTVAEELARLMTCVQKFSASGAVQANVDIRLLRNALRFYSNATAKSFFAEALEAIPALTADGERQVEDILKTIKMRMRLQLMCFSMQSP